MDWIDISKVLITFLISLFWIYVAGRLFSAGVLRTWIELKDKLTRKTRKDSQDE